MSAARGVSIYRKVQGYDKQHFRDPEDFSNTVNLQQELLGHCRWKRKLKDNALIPSIFSYTPEKKPHIQSELRAARGHSQKVLSAA